MARSIQDIFDSIKGEALRLAMEANNQLVIDMLANTSRVAIWKILFYAVAFGIYSLEVIYDFFRLEVDDRLLQLKPHSARWYAEKAKAFQYGYPLIVESDYYDNSQLTEDQVNDSKIISYAAVVEQTRGIRIKVAKLVGGVKTALEPDELTAFAQYMEDIKDAGIKLLITSGPPDELKAKLRVFYNPLVLRGDGGRIDGTDNMPVQNALNKYLDNLPFNGLFVPQLAVDQLQAVNGVVIVRDDQWTARYGTLDFAGVDVEYNPDAGYLKIADNGLEIAFIPHAVI